MPWRRSTVIEARSASREAALKGGVHGPSIVPGKPDASKLFRMVAGLDKPSMPMDGKLQPEQVQAFRQMD